MQTAAGNVEFTNDAVFSHDWTGYHLIWQDQLIFPELSATDKVQVTSEEAKRGDILDRNGRQLAGEGTAAFPFSCLFTVISVMDRSDISMPSYILEFRSINSSLLFMLLFF